jgi:predicted transcriptional regulator
MPLQPRLSELEQNVMDIVWNHPRISATDVQSLLASKRILKDSTVRTILTRLEQKGFLEHDVEGRTFLYRGSEHPGRVAGRAVKQILDRFCHGSLESLLSGMVDDEMVDPDELRRITERLTRERAARIGKPTSKR